MTLTICGLESKTREGIKYGSELWCLAIDKELAPRADLVFEIHEPHMWAEGMVEYLNEIDRPVIMQQRYKGIRRARRFPREQVTRRVGRYLECSISYMLALAYTRRAKHVAIYGVTGLEEYGWQRPNLEYIVGLMKGQGQKVWIHPKSGLLKPSGDGLYGIGEFDGTRKIREWAALHTERGRKLNG